MLKLLALGVPAALIAACVGAAHSHSVAAATAGSVVKVVKAADGYQLLRNGKPYFIKGAGGSGLRALLVASGANSIRTWGADDLGTALDQAQKDGLTVTVGIWLQHSDGFDYNDDAKVSKQFAMCKEIVAKYKNHPALLMWAFGNEMECYGKGDNLGVWRAIEDIAAMSKKVDPNHPTMTVIAEIGGERVPDIHKYCPDIDVIGINSYGGAPSLAERYRKQGGTKPYILTEFGPPGIWETGKTKWDAAYELTSTQKAGAYRDAYQKAVLDQKGLCLGSYVFAWGFKQEATATWYGMFLPDGSKVAAVDTMAELWSGKKPKNLCPRINSLSLSATEKLQPGETITAKLDADDPEGDKLTVKWVLVSEVVLHSTAGEEEAKPPSYPEAILEASTGGATIRLPKWGGGYRVFAYVYDGKGGAAVANVPLFVEGPPPAIKGSASKLPLNVYADAGEPMAFLPSGWMGNIPGMKLELGCTTNPHSGKTCIQFDYTATTDWGGIVWQWPEKDWGDSADSRDLTGAKKLTFWLRGDNGGEKLSVAFGLIGKDKKYSDSASGKLAEIVLGTSWKQYSIDVAGKDLTRIKTGFAITVGAASEPFRFFIDDVRYE